ncbi:MAG: translation initiation factor IF-2, partial [Rhodanobacteraceae bacterium]
AERERAEARAKAEADAEAEAAADAEEVEAEKPEPAEESEPPVEEAAAPATAAKAKTKTETADKPVSPADLEAAASETGKRGARKVREKTSHKQKSDGGRGDRDGGRRQLHLSDADRARRSSRKRSRPSRSGQSTHGSGPHGFSRPVSPQVREVPIGETIVVSDLAQKMAVKGADVVKAMFKMGVMATINQSIDHDTAALVVEEMGHKPVVAEEKGAESALLAQQQSGDAGEMSTRPPVVTIMGHVDHGKTSLLDTIRRTKVASGEAGGITQHIGAYHVETAKGVITFLDTPGHAAFTSMRARGAKSTDIVVLIVAADDGVMPQTVEAINHAKAAKVPIIVAVNKMDKPEANPDNVKQGLAQHEVIPEDWGGEVQFVPVSAKTGDGIDDLLDAVSLQAELLELKAQPSGRASGLVIESRLDKGRGPVATVLVQQGSLGRGDFIVCGVEYGRVRALFDENGEAVDAAGPSIPVEVLGLSGVPEAGDEFVVVADERLAKDVAAERNQKRRETRLTSKTNRLEDIMEQMGKGDDQQNLNIVIKADVQGSAEALRDSLTDISNENIKISVITAGVGGITESDATLAAASDALIIGFNVRADASARKVIETGGLDLRYFSIIYDVIDQVRQVATGLLGTEVREDIIGTAEVREVFRSSRFGAVAGCMVVEGVVKRNKPIRVLRDDTVIFEGELESLRRVKDNVDEVRSGTECGIGVKQYNDIKEGDRIECFERVEVARTL